MACRSPPCAAREALRIFGGMTAEKRAPAQLGEELLALAEAQLAAGHLDVAVVISQIAVEAVAEVAFFTLFGLNLPQSTDTMLTVLPDRSFMQNGTRRLWEDLTGDRLSKAPHWKNYSRHIERRNRAAHGSTHGLAGTSPITEKEAKESLDATRGMVEHLQKVLVNEYSQLVGQRGQLLTQLDQGRGLSALRSRRDASQAEPGK